MTRTSTVTPDNVKEYLPCKSTSARLIKGTYYVYKYTAVKLPSGKWGTDSGYVIGKIIPGKGFMPNKRYMKEQEELGIVYYKDGITDVAYGQYGLLMHLSADVYERLKKHFPLEMATQIYSYGLILSANNFVYKDQVDEYYQESFLSVLFGDYSFKMGYKALSSLLHHLGSRGEPVRDFEQSLIDECSKNIAIDGHVIRSCSELNDLAEPGYKTKQLKAPQVNLLIAYDTKTNIPLLYRTFRGSSVDKRSCEAMLRSHNFTNVKFVVDKGFRSPAILKAMSSDGNSYIIPVLTSDKNFKRIKENLEYTEEFIYKIDAKNSARILYYREELQEGKTITVYKDVDENNSKRKSYRINMDLSEDGYTQEGYDEHCDWWGVYILESTTGCTAEQDFKDYKDRWSIETFNNYIKNDAGFTNLKIQDYYEEQGFNFIMLVCGLIHAKLNRAVIDMKKPSISTVDILLKAGHMRMVKSKDHIWELRNTRTKDIELLDELGFKPMKTYSAASNT